MSSLAKIPLYARTVMHLKPSQVKARLVRKLGGKTPLKRGYVPSPDVDAANLGNVALIPELDFDPQFLARFDVDELIHDRICLLHHAEDVDWITCWNASLSTPLWMFNLHYFEYLLPLAKAYLDTSDSLYLEKGKSIVEMWIESCPVVSGGPAWDPYTISMRCVNWLAFCGETGLEHFDSAFMKRVSSSLLEQYRHLAAHLETDLLANHYFENLKALGMLACYFGDSETLSLLIPKLKEQIQEQILPDGIHFELSPMYHKIVLEDMMRFAKTLDISGYAEAESVDFRLQDMIDVLYSLERNVNRTPLFNDSGDNVAKGRDALLACAYIHFGLEPHFKSLLPDAGYCIIERQTDAGLVKVIFDAGNPGPIYAMGHVHCDALSFECFIDGKPWIVNCGTYAYQDETRIPYKLSIAHNTIVTEGYEQHECWSSFRVARYGMCKLITLSENVIEAELKTYGGCKLRRRLVIDNKGITVRDSAIPSDMTIMSALHFSYGNPFTHSVEGTCPDYAPDFGAHKGIEFAAISSSNDKPYFISFPFSKEDGSENDMGKGSNVPQLAEMNPDSTS